MMNVGMNYGVNNYSKNVGVRNLQRNKTNYSTQNNFQQNVAFKGNEKVFLHKGLKTIIPAFIATGALIFGGVELRERSFNNNNIENTEIADFTNSIEENFKQMNFEITTLEGQINSSNKIKILTLENAIKEKIQYLDSKGDLNEIDKSHILQEILTEHNKLLKGNSSSGEYVQFLENLSNDLTK